MTIAWGLSRLQVLFAPPANWSSVIVVTSQAGNSKNVQQPEKDEEDKNVKKIFSKAEETRRLTEKKEFKKSFNPNRCGFFGDSLLGASGFTHDCRRLFPVPIRKFSRTNETIKTKRDQKLRKQIPE